MCFVGACDRARWSYSPAFRRSRGRRSLARRRWRTSAPQTSSTAWQRRWLRPAKFWSLARRHGLEVLSRTGLALELLVVPLDAPTHGVAKDYFDAISVPR